MDLEMDYKSFGLPATKVRRGLWVRRGSLGKQYLEGPQYGKENNS